MPSPLPLPPPRRALRTATRRTSSAAALSLALVGGALVAGAGPAAADPGDADLTGVVVNASGAPVAGIGVRAFRVDPADGSADTQGELDHVVTGPDGRYTFTGLDPASLSAAQKPVTDQVKLKFDDDNVYPPTISGYRTLLYQTTYLGALSSKKSPTVTVPASGTATVPTQAVDQYGGIMVTVLGASGRPVTSGTVLLYDGDDLPVQTSSTETDDPLYDDPATPEKEPAPADGLVTFPNQVAGRTYKVFGTGSDTSPSGSLTTYLGAFSGGTDVLASAARIPVVPGAYTRVTINLVSGLTAVQAPRVIGDAGYGAVLRADPGRWSRNAGTEYSYQWVRGSRVVGTGPTYAVTKADKKAHLRVVVTAYYGDFVGVATSPQTGKVGLRSKIRARKRAGAVAVTVRLASARLARKRGAPVGKVVLLDATGARVSRKVPLTRGRALLTPRRGASGPLTVAYLGGGGTGPSTIALRNGGKKQDDGGK